MESITEYTVYIMPLFIALSAIATGVIFIKNKNIGNALLFAGFTIHLFPSISSLFFNISPMELNEAGQAVKKADVFFSFYKFIIIEVIAYFSITLGFVLNAYATFKKT